MELKYKQVIDHLLRIFTSERYKEGDKLPTETLLMNDLGVGRNTIRKAIMEMEEQGIVKRRQGSGTFYVNHVNDDVTSGGLVGLANFSGLGYIYPQIIKGVEDALYDDGYSLVIASSNIDSLRNISSLKMMLDQNIKGLILDLSRTILGEVEAPILELVKSIEIPVVTTHWSGKVENISTVSLDDEHGGYKATKYLLDNGHTRIGIVYKSSVLAGVMRFNGYCRALKEAGIELNENFITTFSDDTDLMDIESSVICTKDLLTREGNNITSIFYFNDLMAIEGYKAIAECGLRIPEDISVIGFDNFSHASSLSPGLTTMDHPKEDLGYWAAKFLIKEIKAHKKQQPKSLVFEPMIVERASVKKI